MPSLSNFRSSSLGPKQSVFVLKNVLLRTFSSPSAEIFLTHLQNNQGNVETTLNSVKAKLDYTCITHVLKMCATNKPELALRFFIWAGFQPTYRHSPYMYSQACKLFEIEQNPQIVVDVVKAYKAEDCIVSVNLFKVILNLCRASKDAKLGLWVLKKMKDLNCRPDTVSYNIVIRLVVQNGELDKGIVLMREMGLIDLYPDMITYVTIIKGLCDAGRLEDAFGLVNDMERHGCVPNAVLYSTLLDGICMHGSLERALEFLNEMEEGNREWKPNVVTYTTIIKGFVEKGKALDALRILEQMNVAGVKPNKVTVISLLNALCKDGHVEEALRVIEKACGGIMKCSELYSLLVTSLCRAGNLKESVNILRMMIDHDMRPSSLASRSVLEGIFSDGRVLDAFRLFDDLENSGYSPPIDSEVYSILLSELCRKNYLVEVVMMANFVVNRRIFLKSPQIEGIIEFLSSSGEHALASQIINMNN